MKRSAIIAFSAAAAFTSELPANAQPGAEASQRMPGIGSVIRTTTANSVSPGLYYTQLRVETSPFALPADDRGRGNLGKAILESLGLRRETRAITVSMTVSANNITYPEYPLLVYRFDGSRRLIEVETIGTRTLPLQRLEAGSKFTVRLSYRYSDQAAFNLSGAANTIQTMIPGTALISPAAAPFVGNVLNMASTIFSLASSQTVGSQQTEEMGPYSAVDAKALVFNLVKPDGAPFGTITVSTLATPTLLRPGGALSAASATDFVERDGEGVTTLRVNVAGASRNLMTEARGLAEYAALARDRTVGAVRTFCQQARNSLERDFALTDMDRSRLIRQALVEVDPALADGQWYTACYDQSERLALQRAVGLNAPPPPPPPPPPTPPAPPDPSGPMSRELKDALGCLLTGLTGDYCSRRAPNARQLVFNAMSEQVRIGQMDFTGLVDLTTLDPNTRLISRDRLLDLLAGKAQSFSCYARGLYLGVDGGSRGYNLRAIMAAGKITGIETIAISGDELRCT